MILAVRHIQHALVCKHPVRPGQLALHGITIGAVAALAGAQDRLDKPRGQGPHLPK